MADRKISELSEAQSVASGDYMVVVTGVGVGGATLTTNKFPLSGLINNIVNIDELIIGGTGIHLVSDINTDSPNTLDINVSGYAYTTHTHLATDITDFSSAVSGEVQQIIKFQTSDIANTGTSLVESSDLVIPLAANSQYLFELGTIFVNNEDSSIISGLINVTGTMSVNYPTKLYGQWTHIDIDNQGVATYHTTSAGVSGYGLLIDTLDTAVNNKPLTVVNKFSVATTSNEADTISFGFITNSTNSATSGVLKQGSWLKAEKIL